MIWLILIVVCLTIAMLCRSLVHTLLHHFGEFLLNYKVKDIRWWHPVISWKNKYVLDEDGEITYKNGKPVRNKKIIQFSDAFHFFNMIELGAFTFAVTIPVCLWMRAEWFMCIAIFLIIGAILILVFNLGYDKIWR
jgi:hypothetical protein